MLGFAVIDAQANDDQIAVWLTSRTAPTAVEHTNAVQLSRTDTTRLNALVADRIIVLTPGTALDLPDGATAMTFTDLDTLAVATSELHAQVVDATRAYMSRTRNRNLVLPEAPPAHTPDSTTAATATGRALAVANHLRWLWRGWLSVDEQRRRRSVAPRTGESPWIMPAELSSDAIMELPPALAERFAPAPVAPVAPVVAG